MLHVPIGRVRTQNPSTCVGKKWIVAMADPGVRYVQWPDWVGLTETLYSETANSNGLDIFCRRHSSSGLGVAGWGMPRNVIAIPCTGSGDPFPSSSREVSLSGSASTGGARRPFRKSVGGKLDSLPDVGGRACRKYHRVASVRETVVRSY